VGFFIMNMRFGFWWCKVLRVLVGDWKGKKSLCCPVVFISDLVS
jgi:hypothetical protein